MNDKMGWIEEQEKKMQEERGKDYFNIEEGSQQFVLLSHCAPLAQVWDNAAKRYRPAEEGDKNPSIKGVCWVLQDGVIKQAKLPYVVVKEIRNLQNNPDWDFTIPFMHPLTLIAKGAGTKEVEYSLQPSPKTVGIPAEILEELKKKPSPEDIVEKIKGKNEKPNYPTAEDEGIDVSKDTPF